jgi:16S rRNA processing protein RimM
VPAPRLKRLGLERRLSKLGDPTPEPTRVAPLPFVPSGPPHFTPLGLVVGPLGLDGRLRVRSLHPDGVDASCLIAADRLWFKRSARQWMQLKVNQVEPHGRDLKLLCFQVEQREQAEQLNGAEVGLDRSDLPEASDDETYWIDLVGLSVVNLQGERLGAVDHLETNGVHDWLVVGPHWIPFVEAYVKDVRVSQGTIQVDWDPAWTE